jgi:hypothetical protein
MRLRIAADLSAAMLTTKHHYFAQATSTVVPTVGT